MAQQNLGAEESVLQNHYKRNHAPRAPCFQPVHIAPPLHQPPPPTNTKSKPRTVESYPPQWQEVIPSAKRAFRAHVAGKCGFPDGVEGMREAQVCLQDAIEVHSEEGGTLEPGMYFLILDPTTRPTKMH